MGKLEQLLDKVQRRQDLLKEIQFWLQRKNTTMAMWVLKRLNATSEDTLTQADLDTNQDPRKWG